MRRLRHIGLPLLVFLVGLMGTAVVTLQFKRLSDARDAERFERLVDQRVEAISDRIDTYVALLRGAAGLFSANETVSRQDFASYVARLAVAELYPGIQGIGFAGWFDAGERRAVETQMREEGFPGFRVTPPEPREQYSAIVFLEPQDERNAAAIGYDMYTDPVRREAMERARDHGVPALSGMVELVQEIDQDKQPGFLIYLPVYEDNLFPVTVEERRALLAGWAYSPFRARDLFSRAIDKTGAFGGRDLVYSVHDGLEPSAGNLLYRSAELERTQGGGEPTGTATRQVIEIAGRSWTVDFAPGASFARDSYADLLPYLFGLGFLATLFLTAAAFAQARTTLEAEKARADLQEETERLERLNRVGNALASELDMERLVRTVIEAATSLSGAAYGAFFERIAPGVDGNPDEAWRLFSLAGAPREAFTRFGLPRPTDLFSPTFAGGGVVRSADVSRDARYGSLGGMPKGHLPVRSYLAVPVVSRSGERLGALLFGHPEPGMFAEKEEKLIAGFAGQAAAALENARLLASVKAGQDRFKAAVQAVRGILWTTDAKGRMVGEQPGWQSMTGQAVEQYQDGGWSAAIHPDDLARTLELWSAAVEEKRTFVHEHRVLRVDGSFGTFAVRAVPVRDADGSVREWVGVHTDITEQREAQTELKESNEEIQRFAYIVSHDLRAPLVNVMGFTSELSAVKDELLASASKPADDPARIEAESDFDEALGFIKAGIVKMERLIAAILKLSREGRRTFTPEPLDMPTLLQGLADAQRHQAEEIEATVEIAPDLPRLVSDRLSVEQIFGNLIDNAIKYSHPDRPALIRITGEERGQRVVYRVKDNGRGIEAKDRDRVFDLFRRAGQQDRPGEGIGLAHVKALVRALGGRIELSSQAGAGTTFTVVMPRVAAKPPEES